MYLFDGKTVLRSYKIGLGSEPVGDKKVQGDGKTPEGLYYIDRKNPKSRYYLSLGISYPNSADKAEAQALGKSPGGDIFIHGEDTKPNFFKRDWTAGCIAVKNREIREIYALVKVGTPILIHP
ncbi:MAG: L,D-transpeptidase family protein [Paracoccaceae bacterium]